MGLSDVVNHEGLTVQRFHDSNLVGVSMTVNPGFTVGGFGFIFGGFSKKNATICDK
jgi:hypothetical protein